MDFESILNYALEIAPAIVAIITVIATGVSTIRKVVKSAEKHDDTLYTENLRLRELIRQNIAETEDLKEEIRRLEKTLSRIED